MFCQNCGKGKQETNTYCRQCGEFLPELRKKGGSGHPKTPDDQIKMSITFNLMSAISGFGVGVLLLISHLNRDNTHFSVFVGMSLLFTIAAWQTASFFNNVKLRRRFKRRKENTNPSQDISQNAVETNESKKLLNQPDLENVVPISITEGTTKNLKEKVKRRS